MRIRLLKWSLQIEGESWKQETSYKIPVYSYPDNLLM